MNTVRTNDENLQRRIERLEAEVGRLRILLEGVIASEPTEPGRTESPAAKVARRPAERPALVGPAAPVRQTPIQEAVSTPAAAERVAAMPTPPWKTMEYWLGRIGIGLVLFGVVFLFKYAVDQGWLTPWARVGLGAAIGAGLFGWGQAVRGSRTVLSRLLTGGGIAAWYITGYSAFQVYALVSHTAAFIFLSAVTALALVLGAGVADPVLSIIGATGGLSTPFMLFTG
ncbi:MAG TPA: DUF2339 domain-containing protein, partial [Candidatus Glassbacteria bacterium]|nr:DUF2339 domain-containing protein [Candidatus Glassbacteria bacterium]